MWMLLVIGVAGGLYALDRHLARKRLIERHWRELRMRPGPDRTEFVQELSCGGVSEAVCCAVYDYYAKKGFRPRINDNVCATMLCDEETVDVDVQVLANSLGVPGPYDDVMINCDLPTETIRDVALWLQHSIDRNVSANPPPEERHG